MKTIEPNNRTPLYYQLEEIIKEQIDSGKWKAGEKIPSENELLKQYEVSRNTVKKALDNLVQAGMLKRIQGKGTFVSKPKLEQSLTGFYSFSKVLEEKGLEPKDVLIELNERKVKASIAKHLGIAEDAYVYELVRLRCTVNEPIILETSYIPKEMIPEMTKEELSNHSLYDFMATKYGVLVTKAKEIFEPVLIRGYESQYLEVEEGSPALLLDRIAYNSEDKPVEFCRSIIRGDRCRFYTELI